MLKKKNTHNSVPGMLDLALARSTNQPPLASFIDPKSSPSTLAAPARAEPFALP